MSLHEDYCIFGLKYQSMHHVGMMIGSVLMEVCFRSDQPHLYTVYLQYSNSSEGTFRSEYIGNRFLKTGFTVGIYFRLDPFVKSSTSRNENVKVVAKGR